MRSLVTSLIRQMILSNKIIDHVTKQLEAQYKVTFHTLIQGVIMVQLILKAVLHLALLGLGLY
ncbi:hypothetical protein EV14_1830 [Prochlorococcus sp. MIT 0703]|nr:hypothetical protein EV12_2893 [Prochlorococcus sp. MIT 0701]KGG32989.1 hypothetical protein EV14_1830 [Prochlorococcus sp. MIT 0703]